MFESRVLKNFSALFLVNIITGVLGFITTVYLARVCGPENFGRLNFALAFITYFLLLGDLGTDLYATREIAKNPDRVNTESGKILSLKLILAIIVSAVYFGTLAIIRLESITRTMLYLFGPVILLSAFLIEWVFQGIQRMHYIGLERLARAVVYSAAVFFFVHAESGILLVPLIYVVGLTVGIAILQVLFFIILKGIRLFPSGARYPSIVRKALPIGISLMMTKVYYNMDSIFLGFMKNQYSVGIYNAAYKILLALLGILFIVGQVILPTITNYYALKSPKLSAFISRVLRLSMLFALPIAVTFTVLSDKIVAIIYAPAYLPSAGIIKILIWLFLICSLSTIFGNSLLAFNQEKKYLTGVTCGAVINTAMNIVLIPKFNYYGAAIATVVTEIVILIYMFHQFYKEIKIPFHPAYWKIPLSALVMGAVMHLTRRGSVALPLAAGTIAYFLILTVTGEITGEKITRLWSMADRNHDKGT
jgi:O-antigen/teichoic acid export membrane protein